MVEKVVFHLCTLYHPHPHPSFLVLPPQSHQTLLSSFSSPINLSRQEITPSSPAKFQKQYTRGGNSKGQHSHLGKSIFGCEGCLPWASGEGRGRQLPGPGAGSEVHAPGGLTDARVRRSREGGNRNRCLEGNRFFVSLLLLDFLSLDCKKLLWWPPTWLGMHTYTEKSGLPRPSGIALLRRKPGLAGPQAPGGFK